MKEPLSLVFKNWGDIYFFWNELDSAERWHREALLLNPKIEDSNWKLAEIQIRKRHGR